ASAAALELKVICERRFAVRHDERLLAGAIDRLVEARRSGKLVAAEILDFKTDAFADDAALAAAVQFYPPPIEAYPDAAARQTGLDRAKISAKLLFVELGKCVDLRGE